MKSYIALLRGINISGHKIIRMEALRACFEGLGCRSVQTYVQSGNVVFEAREKDAVRYADELSKRIQRDFGFPVPVLLRTSEELEHIVRHNPFLKQPGIDPAKLHVTFLSAPAPKSTAEHLKTLATALEQFHVRGREIYLYCPNGYGRTKLSNAAIEKKLDAQATTRNWKSVQALVALAHSCGSQVNT
jgi:uncharacterized protein (DUF1697 family)